MTTLYIHHIITVLFSLQWQLRAHNEEDEDTTLKSEAIAEASFFTNLMKKKTDPINIIDKYFEKGAKKTMFQTLTGKNWMSNNSRVGRRASSTINNNNDLFDGDNTETRSESELQSKMLGIIKRYEISV